MITRDQLQQKYTHITKIIGHAHAGGQIIGEEIDENNQIHYVVRRGSDLSIEDFNTAKPKLFISPDATSLVIYARDKKSIL